MNSLLIAMILCATSLTFAADTDKTNQAPGEGDVVGTIQEPTAQNKKIIKKIMTRKKKSTVKKSETSEPTETK